MGRQPPIYKFAMERAMGVTAHPARPGSPGGGMGAIMRPVARPWPGFVPRGETRGWVFGTALAFCLRALLCRHGRAQDPAIQAGLSPSGGGGFGQRRSGDLAAGEMVRTGVPRLTSGCWGASGWVAGSIPGSSPGTAMTVERLEVGCRLGGCRSSRARCLWPPPPPCFAWSPSARFAGEDSVVTAVPPTPPLKGERCGTLLAKTTAPFPCRQRIQFFAGRCARCRWMPRTRPGHDGGGAGRRDVTTGGQPPGSKRRRRRALPIALSFRPARCTPPA